MKKLQIFIEALIIIFIMAIPLIMLSLVIWYFRSIDGHIPGILFLAGIIGVPAAAFYFTSKILEIPVIYKMLKDVDVAEIINRKNKKKKFSKKIEGLTVDKSLYSGVEKNYSQYNSVKGTIFVLLLVISGYWMWMDVIPLFFILTIIFALVIVFYYFGRRIIISEKGIRYVSLFKDQFLEWDEIQNAGVSVLAQGQKAPDWLMMVYVSRKKLKMKHVVLGKNEKGIITFKFRAKMIHHMITYYDGELKNIETVRRWRNYLIRNGVSDDSVGNIYDELK